MVPFQVPGNVTLSSDNVVGTSGKPIRVFHIHLVSGGTLSTTIFKNGTTTGGTAYLQADGVANKGSDLDFHYGVRFPNGCFMDTDANISYCTISYTEEQL